jgi:hypothetical protein
VHSVATRQYGRRQHQSGARQTKINDGDRGSNNVPGTVRIGPLTGAGEGELCIWGAPDGEHSIINHANCYSRAYRSASAGERGGDRITPKSVDDRGGAGECVKRGRLAKNRRRAQAEQHGEAQPHQRREPYCRALPRGIKSITASIRVSTVVLLESTSGFDFSFPSLFPLLGVACCRCDGMNVSCVKLTPLLWRGLQQPWNTRPGKYRGTLCAKQLE